MLTRIVCVAQFITCSSGIILQNYKKYNLVFLFYVPQNLRSVTKQGYETDYVHKTDETCDLYN